MRIYKPYYECDVTYNREYVVLSVPASTAAERQCVSIPYYIVLILTEYYVSVLVLVTLIKTGVKLCDIF